MLLFFHTARKLRALCTISVAVSIIPFGAKVRSPSPTPHRVRAGHPRSLPAFVWKPNAAAPPARALGLRNRSVERRTQNPSSLNTCAGFCDVGRENNATAGSGRAENALLLSAGQTGVEGQDFQIRPGLFEWTAAERLP